MFIKNFLIDTPFEFQIIYDNSYYEWKIVNIWKEFGEEYDTFHYAISLGVFSICFGVSKTRLED